MAMMVLVLLSFCSNNRGVFYRPTRSHHDEPVFLRSVVAANICIQRSWVTFLQVIRIESILKNALWCEGHGWKSQIISRQDFGKRPRDESPAGLRHIRIGVETTERAKQTHVFLSEVIPYTLKKITKDVKIRHVALECMGDVLARLSKSEHIHLKIHEGRRLGLWTGILEASCGAGSSVARATGKRKYKSSRPYLWPVLTAALCCAPPEVFRLGVSQHIEHLVQTAQDPLLTSMALKCIQDTVEAFLIYHTSGVKADVVFDVLQDTARLLICDNSPPKLNDESVKIFADIIQVVSKHNFDFAMLNMVVALIKQGVEDSRESLAKQMKQFQHSKFKVKNYQDFISPNFSWKVEVALVALSKSLERQYRNWY